MRRMAVAVVLAVLVAGGCGGSGKSRVKGQLFLGPGNKLTLEGGEQAFFSLVGVSPNGTPDLAKTYPCHLNKDGSFELVASGGELPPGSYRVVLEIVGMSAAPVRGTGRQQADRLGGRFSRDNSPVKVEVKAGKNDLQIELPVK